MTSPFPPRLRGILLGLPFLFLLTAIVGHFTGYLVESRSRVFELFVILFLTSPHGVFSLPMLGLPEFRQMIRARTNGSTIKFWLPVGVAFFLGLVMYTAAQESRPAGENATIVAQLLIELIAYEHGIKQIFGISLVYNSRLRREGALDQSQLAALARSETLERRLFTVFAPTYLVFRTCDLLKYVDGHSFISSFLAKVVIFPRVFTILLGAAILLNVILLVRKTRDWERLVYTGRMSLFMGAAAGLPTAFMNGSLLASHASEYMGVYGTLQRNSRAPWGRKIALIMGTVTLTGVLLPLVYLSHSIRPPEVALGLAIVPWLPLLHALSAVEGGLAFTHYYLDRQFFRARYAAVREHVMPLFQSNKTAA